MPCRSDRGKLRPHRRCRLRSLSLLAVGAGLSGGCAPAESPLAGSDLGTVETSLGAEPSLDEIAATTLPADATTSSEVPPASTSTTSTAPPSPTTTTTLPLMSSQRLELVLTVVDERLRPKSVIATSSGLLFAQNMMYRHNVMVLDAEGEIVAVIDDAIDQASFDVGVGVVRGAPVEAVESVDGRYVFVSNYKMYGPGYVSDACLLYTSDAADE